MDVLRRCECPTHGNTLTVADGAGRRFCVPHERYVKAVEVEYVRADAYQGAVDALRYIAGEDVAGMEGHMRSDEVAASALAALGVGLYASQGGRP